MDSLPRVEKYHPHYGDPAADIVLKPSFGAPYRVHSWYLAQQSDLFKRIRSKKGFYAGTYPPVETHIDPSLLDIFLAFVHTHPPPRVYALPGPLSLEHLVALYTFAKKLECPKFLELLMAQMDKNTPGALFAQLELASEDDNVGLAKAVLFCLSPEKIKAIGFWKTVDAIKAEWRIPFIRVMLPANEQEITFNSSQSQRSDRFDSSPLPKRKTVTYDSLKLAQKRAKLTPCITQWSDTNVSDAQKHGGENHDEGIKTDLGKLGDEADNYEDGVEDSELDAPLGGPRHTSDDGCDCPNCNFGPTDEEGDF